MVVLPVKVFSSDRGARSESPAAPTSPNRRQASEVYYPYFDYLRMVLALGVFAAHAPLDIPEHVGNFCVQVFFALSGFLIGSILVESRPSDLPRFYFKRTTRIWIPYAIAIVLLFAGCLAKGQTLTPTIAEYFFYKATFVYNWFGQAMLATSRADAPLQGTGHHFWSICVEEQFYLVAPLIMVLCGRFRSVVLAGLLVVVPLLGTWVFTSIVLGVFLALSDAHFGSWYRKRGAVLLLLLAIGVAAYLMQTTSLPYVSLAPVAAVSIVALLAHPGSGTAAGKLVGGVSYPFYLNHWIGIFFIRPVARVTGTEALGIAIGLTIAISLSAAHYWLVDKNILRYRSGWYSPKVGIRCSVAGFAAIIVGLTGAALWRL